MAAGAGLGTILPLVMTLTGLVTILRARWSRGGDRTDQQTKAQARRDATAETERRMAFYLASREGTSRPQERHGTARGAHAPVAMQETEKETGR